MASNVAGERSRGVNWFEGGRRISKLLMVVVLGIGAFILIATTADTATFFTSGPDQPWRFQAKACQYPNDSRSVSDVDVSAAGENVELCFETLQNGKIPYAVAPEPAGAAQVRKKREARESAEAVAEDKVLMARGQPPPIRTVDLPRWYYGGNMFDDQVVSYEDEREKSFRLTPEMARQVRESSSSRLWAARSEAFRSGAPWVFGVIAFIWVFTAVIGWIVRGFAGVPMGADFRTSKPAE